MTPGDEGVEVQRQEVPAIGGADYRAKEGLPTSAPIVKSEHVGDAMRAEGVNYTEVPGMDVTTRPFPPGTKMTDSTPSDDIN